MTLRSQCGLTLLELLVATGLLLFVAAGAARTVALLESLRRQNMAVTEAALQAAAVIEAGSEDSAALLPPAGARRFDVERRESVFEADPNLRRLVVTVRWDGTPPGEVRIETLVYNEADGGGPER